MLEATTGLQNTYAYYHYNADIHELLKNPDNTLNDITKYMVEKYIENFE
jgi:hypothetical protein